MRFQSSCWLGSCHLKAGLGPGEPALSTKGFGSLPGGLLHRALHNMAAGFSREPPGREGEQGERGSEHQDGSHSVCLILSCELERRRLGETARMWEWEEKPKATRWWTLIHHWDSSSVKDLLAPELGKLLAQLTASPGVAGELHLAQGRVLSQERGRGRDI